MPATPTVSVCPQKISDRPRARPSRTPTTFGRPGATSSIETSRPIRRRCAAMAAAICCSPAAPGTSVGLTESIATRSRSSAMHGSTRVAYSKRMDAKDIALAVRDAGGRALGVGGWVRDRLMGGEGTNLDIEVFGVAPDRLRALLETLGRVEAVGESFQVYEVGGIDVPLPRRDSKSGRGHKGFVVVGDPDDLVHLEAFAD